MPAAPEQIHGVCGPDTPVADVGVDAARWAIPAPWDVNIADEDSSEESIGEETDRRRAVVKPIDLGRPPTGPGFQSWLAELYAYCCAASNRSRRRTMRFLKAVEKAPTHKTLEVCSRKWERFDAELAAALFSIRIKRGASQAQDVPRCVWSCCFVVCLAEVCCRGRSASAGRILSRLIGLTFSGDLGLFLGSPDKNLDGAGGACLGGLGVDGRGPTAPRSLQDQRPTSSLGC